MSCLAIYNIPDIYTSPLLLSILRMFSGRGRAYINVEVTVPYPFYSDMMLVTSVDNTVKYQKMNFCFSPEH